MKLTCPQCQTELQLDPIVIPEEGMVVSCYQCLHNFQLSLPSETHAYTPVRPEIAEAPRVAHVDPLRDSLEEIDFSGLTPQPSLGQGFPKPVDVGAALFGGSDDFGFELPKGSSSTFAAIPPPGTDQTVSKTPQVPAITPQIPERPVRPSRPRRPDASVQADLPRPSRKAPPKAFQSPQIGQQAPSRMEAVFVEEPPQKESSISAHRTPSSPSMPRATPGNELFAVQSAPSQGNELFAVQSAPSQGNELFAVQSAPSQGEEFFAIQSAPSQGNELFAVQNEAFNHDLFAVQSGGDAGLDALFNTPSSSNALGSDFSIDPGGEMDLFARGADALFELENTPEPPRSIFPPPAVSPSPSAQHVELPNTFTLPEVASQQPPPPPHQAISPIRSLDPIEEPSHFLEALEPESLNEDVETSTSEDSTSSNTESSGSRRPSPLLLIALLFIVAVAGVHRYDSTLIPSLLGASDPPKPPQRTANLKVIQKNQKAPQAVALPTNGIVAPSKDPHVIDSQTTSPANHLKQDQNTTNTATSTPPKQNQWYPIASGLRDRLSTSLAKKLNHPQLAQINALDSEGYQQIVKDHESTSAPSTQALNFARGSLYFPQEPRWSKEASQVLKSLDPSMLKQDEVLEAHLANALSQQLDRSQENAIAFGLARPNDGFAQELLGHAFLSRGQSALAEQAFSRALTLNPNRPLLKLRQAELLLDNGKLDEAELAFKALQKEDLDHAAVRRGLAMIEVKRQNTKKAFTWIDALFQQPTERFDPQSKAQNLVMLAQILDLDQDQAQAAGETRGDETLIEREQVRTEALRNAVKSWPDHMPALSMLFEPMRKAQRERDALKQLNELTLETGETPASDALHARLLLDVDREAKALETLQKAVKSNPNSIEAHEALGRELMRRKEFVGARAAFEAVALLTPNPERSELLFSELLIKEARVDEAQALLEESIRKRPWSPQLRSRLADLKLKIGLRNGQERLIRESYESFDRVLMLHPGDQHARLQRARASISLGKAQEALADLSKLTGEPELRGLLDFELGEAKMSLQNDRDAKVHFNAVLKREPSNLQALRAMGQLYERAGDDAQAKRSLEQALAVNTRDSETRYELGRLSLKTKANQEAIEHLRIAAEAKLQDPQVQYWFGRALETSDDRKVSGEARAVYENTARLIQELKQVPKELCDVHYRVGKIHSKNTSELSRALDDFMRASECDSSRADIWTELATQYDRLGDQKQALSYFQDALKRDRNFAPALIGVARSHLRETPPQSAKALKLLEKAIKISPKSSEPYYHLCKIYQFKSRKKAQKSCQSYLQNAPEGEFAREVREILKSL